MSEDAGKLLRDVQAEVAASIRGGGGPNSKVSAGIKLRLTEALQSFLKANAAQQNVTRGRSMVERCEDTDLVTCDPAAPGDCPDRKYFIPGKGLSNQWWSNTWTMKNGKEMRCVDPKFAGRGARRPATTSSMMQNLWGSARRIRDSWLRSKEVNRSLMPSMEQYEHEKTNDEQRWKCDNAQSLEACEMMMTPQEQGGEYGERCYWDPLTQRLTNAEAARTDITTTTDSGKCKPVLPGHYLREITETEADAIRYDKKMADHPEFDGLTGEWSEGRAGGDANGTAVPAFQRVGPLGNVRKVLANDDGLSQGDVAAIRPFPTPSTTTNAAGLLDASMSNPVEQWNAMTKPSTATSAFVKGDTKVQMRSESTIQNDPLNVGTTFGEINPKEANVSNLIAHQSREFAGRVRRLQGRTSVLWYHLLYALRKYRRDTMQIGQYEQAVAKAVGDILYTHIKNCDYGLELADEIGKLDLVAANNAGVTIQKLRQPGVFRPQLRDTLTDDSIEVNMPANDLNIANFYGEGGGDAAEEKRKFVAAVVNEFARYTVNEALQLCFRAMIAAQRRRTLTPVGPPGTAPTPPDKPLTIPDARKNFGRT